MMKLIVKLKRHPVSSFKVNFNQFGVVIAERASSHKIAALEEKLNLTTSAPSADQYGQNELKKKYIVLEGQVEDMKEKNQQVQAQYNQLKSTHEMAVRETAELRDQFRQAEEQIDELQVKASAAKSASMQATIHKATIDSLETKIEALEADLKAANERAADSSDSSSSSDEEEIKQERTTVVAVTIFFLPSKIIINFRASSIKRPIIFAKK